MTRRKVKLSADQKREKSRRKAEFMTVMINGKQKRVGRPPLVDGLTPEEFIRAKADPIWLHQNELWEYMADVATPTDRGEADNLWTEDD